MEVLRKGNRLERTKRTDGANIADILGAFNASDSEDEAEYNRVFRGPRRGGEWCTSPVT
jgi:hypothetical protein